MKTKAKTLVLILLITLSMASLINISINLSPRVSLPQTKQENEEINTSMPITPEYKYHYENDFDLYWYTLDSVYYAQIFGHQTEWSQDPNDDLELDIWFYNHLFQGQLDPFSMSASLFVESHNSFKKQPDSTLGAYIDFHVGLNILEFYGIPDIRSVDLILMIIDGATFEPVHLLTINNPAPQQYRFYIPNFNRFINATTGKVRFALMGITYGFVPTFTVGGLSLFLRFEGLRITQEIVPEVQPTEKRTLIFVHGFGPDPCTPENWATFYTPEFLKTYDTIIVINYVGYFYGFRYSKGDTDWTILDMNTPITLATSIAFIALVLKDYIKLNYEYIGDKVDFICHSMGGLVTRWMIKFFYAEIQAFYNNRGKVFDIENVCLIATPNHGVWFTWILSLFIPPFPLQISEMIGIPPSPFLIALNADDETPYTPDISWYTYRSGVRLTLGVRHDGMVDEVSAQLNGAVNRGWFQLDHEILRQSNMVKTVIFNDLIKPPQLINSIFNGGTPGIIMKIEDLTLQPNYDEPGGKTLLSIALPSEDANDIDKTSVTLHISTNDYQMTLKGGTEDTYEVELPLVEENYPFSITADELDGGLYQISGNLRIIDDDVIPPEIQITPGDISISDEDAVGGVLVEWEISDYSGISEASVTLNGVEINSYTNQGAITDSHLLANELGEYNISVWARDNDNDPEHDPPGEDWSETSVERTITIYDDDINPPVIQITPGDLYISDEEAIGGVLISWEISDYSGIFEANVTLNGVEIGSYTNQGTITDSYLLPNELGVYSISIWAKDNDNDSEDDRSEYLIEKSITIYDDDLNPPDIQITPGDLDISVEEAEGGILVEWEISDYSGISEANVLINGIEIRSYANQGTITDSFLLANEPGVYNFSIWAKDNDNDLENDWLEDSTIISITIYEDNTPSPAIPGYSIFIILGIISVIIIPTSKKRRNFKI